MSDFRDRLTHWLDDRLGAVLSAPAMWGSEEAVEMQALLLFELQAFARQPGRVECAPGEVLDAYAEFLRRKFPGRPRAPLSELAPEQLSAWLSEFHGLLLQSFPAENPFEHHDLVVRLEYKADTRPKSTAFTSYCDGVRRAARAFARSDGKKGGRVRKEFEALTDFPLDEVRITQPNGVPARATLMMGRGVVAQEHLFAPDQVREAFQKLAAVATWAESDRAVDALAIDHPNEKTKAAVQTLRLLPRGDVSTVEIGGRLVGFGQPFALRAQHAQRCVSVLAAASAPAEFDEQGELRGIDLDRGTITLGQGRTRHTCYVADPAYFEWVSQVGVKARVTGEKYTPALSPAFVLVEDIELS